MFLELAVASSIYFVRKNAALYVIWVSLAYFCQGGHFSTFPAATLKIFGIQHGGQLWTIMQFSCALCSLTGFIITEYAKDLVSIETLYIIGAVCICFNIISLTFFNEEPLEIKIEPKK